MEDAMKKDWWLDEEATDKYVARLIVATLDGDGEWDEFEEFADAHDPIPVTMSQGRWWVTDSRGNAVWEIGVTSNDVDGKDGEKSTIGEIANSLNLTSSTLAADYGWPSDSWPLSYYERNFPSVARAMARYERRRADERQEAREEALMAREEMELFDRETREGHAQERGETLVYAPHGTTVEQAAELLGMPEDSQTVRLYVTRMLDLREALRRARVITHRHESTDYDRLLAAGIDRDTARHLILE
jgi:hypothetical protein